MIIKKIKIHHFGKHNNLELTFTDGLNIIYGKNEAGKSTIQAFIKAMFYGIDSRRQSLRENERKRFHPWDDSKMSGEITFIGSDGMPWVIYREFGKTKKNDIVEIYNEITGVKNANMSVDDLGRQLFNAGSETFENTVFIGQLGCMVSSGDDKDGEIMKKLSNLSQSGNEDISYQTVYETMNIAGNEILSKTGKRGKLAELDKRLNELTEEKLVALSAMEEISEDRAELKKLVGINSGTINRIKEVEKEKYEAQNNELLKDYHEISGYVRKINELEADLSIVEKSLNVDNNVITRGYVNELNEEFRNYKLITIKRDELSARLNSSKEAYSKLEKRVNELKSYEEVDSIKLLEYMSRSRMLAEKIQDDVTRLKQLDSLKAELDEKRTKLGETSIMENITPEIESEILNNENELRKLKADTSALQKVNNLELKIESYHNKSNVMKLLTAAGAVIIILSMFLGLFYSPAAIVFSLAGLALVLFAVPSLLKNNKSIKKLNDELELSRVNPNDEEIILITNCLNEIYQTHGTSDFNEFQNALSKYKIHSHDVNELKAKILALESLAGENIKDDSLIQKTEADLYLKESMEKTGQNDLEVIVAMKKEYDILINKMNVQKEFCDNLAKETTDVNTHCEDSYKSLIDNCTTAIGFWKSSNPGKEFFIDFIPDLLKDADKLLIKRDCILNDIQAARQTRDALLKGHSIDELRQKCEALMSEGKYYDSSAVFRPVAEIDDELSGLKEDHLALEKDIKKLENHIELAMANIRPINETEEEIIDISEQQTKLKNHLACLNIAMEVLKDSFEEMQQNFGPVLNESAGKVLSELTGGKYSDIRVSQQYEVRIAENSGSLRESGFFSNGTLDQIYFALRMAISDLVFDSSVPVFLDDPFVQYDDDRLKLAVSYLGKRASNSQIILFTCHNKIPDMKTDVGSNVIGI